MIWLNIIEKLNEFIVTYVPYFPSFRISDIFEILLLIFIVYKVIRSLKNSRVVVVGKGLFILFIFYNIAYLLNFEVIVLLFESILSLLLFALIIVFQPELRKILEQIGTKGVNIDIKALFGKSKPVFKYYEDNVIDELAEACFSMSAVKTGALIVIEREIPLNDYFKSGTMLNADLSAGLLVNIFEKNTPLHDGAVVMYGNKVKAAACVLPISQTIELAKRYGTRHRAACTTSEVTDAIVLVVSEETGGVSLFSEGKMKKLGSPEVFKNALRELQIRKVIDLNETVSKEKFSFKSIIHSNNFKLKVASVIVGFLGWILMVNITNPVTTKVISDIPIEFTNVQVIESTGKTFEVLSEEYVDIIVKDKRSVVDKISRSDVVVVADLTKLSVVNAVQLQAIIDKYPSAEIKFVESDTINVKLDNVISKEVNVELEKTVDSNSLTYVPELHTETNRVVVKGGKSLVNTVDKIVCTYDVTDAEGTYKGEAIPIVYDKNGDIIDSKSLQIGVEKVYATGKVYNVKEIPIKVDLGTDVVSGLKVHNVVSEPLTIKLSGDDSVLNNLKLFEIDLDISVNSQSVINNQYSMSVNILDYIPKGLYYVGENEKIDVIINFETLNTKDFEFTTDEFRIDNLASNLNVSFKDKFIQIRVSGEDSVLESLTKENIKPFLDVSGLEAGSYNLIVQFDGFDNVIIEENKSVKLDISEK